MTSQPGREGKFQWLIRELPSYCKARLLHEVNANRNLIRDLWRTLATRVFVILAGVVSGVITARALGPAGRGEYFYVVTLAQLATQVGHLGLASSNTYVVAREPAALSRLAANSLWVSLSMGSLAAFAIVALEKAFGRVDRIGLTLVLPILVPCLIYGLLASNILIGMGFAAKYNVFMLTNTGLQLVGIIAVAAAGGGAWAMLWVSAAASLLAAIRLRWLVYQLGGRVWRPDFGTLMGGMGFAVRVYVATLVPFVVGRLNVVMIDTWSNSADLGRYSVAVQLFDTLLVLPGTIAMLLFPELVKSKSADRFGRTVRIATLVVFIMLCMSLLLAAVAPWLLPTLFGRAFESGVVVLWLMLPGLVSLSALNIFSQYLAAEGFPASNLWAWVGSLAVLVALGAALIPRLGAAGGAIALSLTYTLLAATLMIASFVRAMQRIEGRNGEE